MYNAHGSLRRVTWSMDGAQPSGPSDAANCGLITDCAQSVPTSGADNQSTHSSPTLLEETLLKTLEDSSKAPDQPCMSSSGQLDSTASIEKDGQNYAGIHVTQSDTGTQQLSVHRNTSAHSGEGSQGEVQDAIVLQPTASTAAAAGPLPMELSVSFLPVDSSTLLSDLNISNSFQQQQPSGSNHAGLSGPLTVPAIDAPAAALLAAVEAPWTQNTARALRRAQQEVVEQLAAQGLPPPAERGYCFDLVGIRAAGPAHTPAALQSNHDWPVVEGVAIILKGAPSQYTSSSGDSAHFSSTGGGHHSLASTLGDVSIRQPSQCRSSFRCTSPAGTTLSSPSTPAATGADLLLMLQQRRGHIGVAEEAGTAQRPASAPSSLGRRQHAQQHQSSRLMATVRGKQQWDDLFARNHLDKQQMSTDAALHLRSTSPGNQSNPHQQLLRHSSPIQHGKQLWDDLFTKHHQKQQQQLSGAVSEHSRKPAASRSRSTSPLQYAVTPSSGVKPLDAGVIARAERSIALHALIAGKAGGTQGCTLAEAASEQQQNCESDDHQNSSTAALQQCQRGELHEQNQSRTSAKLALRPVVPDKWWTMADKAVNDPLLLTLPIWMRDALDLELMPL